MQMQDRIGQQLGNYRLVRPIGRGTYSEVYLAEHIYLTNTQYAIKIFTGATLQDAQRNIFLKAVDTIANLQHLSLHIAQIHDLGLQVSKDEVKDGIPYFVMEYASKGTLRNLYPHGQQVPLERIVFYVNQITEALQYAHNQGPAIIHRDVKPENMLLKNFDHVLLSDFGIAMISNVGIIAKAGEKSRVIGTVAYIAPEQFSGLICQASDQYSLGIVVYEWLCGEYPFEGTDEEVMAQHLLVDPPSLHGIYPYISKEIEDVVMCALKKNPEDRYPTVQEFAHALEEAVQSSKRQVWQAASIVNSEGPQSIPLIGQPDQGLSFSPRKTRQLNDITIEPQVHRQILPSNKIIAQLPKPLFQRIREFFDFSPQFARDYRFSFFRNCGIALNILSAITVGLLLQNGYVLFDGLLFSFLMFALCIRAIEEALALFFGTLVALYWGGVGWVIGNYTLSLLHLTNLFPPLLVGLVFFGGSLRLHIWYVMRKNL